jgi:hypothetical protein
VTRLFSAPDKKRTNPLPEKSFAEASLWNLANNGRSGGKRLVGTLRVISRPILSYVCVAILAIFMPTIMLSIGLPPLKKILDWLDFDGKKFAGNLRTAHSDYDCTCLVYQAKLPRNRVFWNAASSAERMRFGIPGGNMLALFRCLM